MSRFRLVVFDLDGTLVDSRRDLAESANAVLAECGCATHPEEAIGRMVGDGAATLVARAFAASGCSQPSHALPRFLEIYNGRLLKWTRAYDGMTDVLDHLTSRATLAVLTNKPLKPTMEILEGLRLAHYFGERTIGGDGPFPRKPDPAGLRHLLELAGASPSESLLVGDSSIDWRTARSAGCQVCLARYGFGFEGFPVGELTGGDLTIDSPRELVALL